METSKCVDCVAEKGPDARTNPLHGEVLGKRYCKPHYDARNAAQKELARVNEINRRTEILEAMPNFGSNEQGVIAVMDHVMRGLLMGTYDAQKAQTAVNIAKVVLNANEARRRASEARRSAQKTIQGV